MTPAAAFLALAAGLHDHITCQVMPGGHCPDYWIGIVEQFDRMVGSKAMVHEKM